MSAYWLATCNTMAGSGSGRTKGSSIIRKTITAFPLAVMYGAVEASNLRGTDPAGWQPAADRRDLELIQHDRIDKAGVAVIIDRGRVEPHSVRYRLGVRPYIGGRRIGMRVRWSLILRASVDGLPPENYRVLHLPPKRFWALWSTMVASVGPRSIDMGDFNKLARAVAPATGKRAVMDDLVGFAVPRSIPVIASMTAEVGADHRAVGARLGARRG